MVMEDFVRLITSQEAGNLGDLLSGLGIAVAAAAYVHQKNQKNVRDFQKKVTQTFYYCRKFKEYYEKFTFHAFSQFLENFLSRKKVEDLKFWFDGMELDGAAAVEITQQQAFDFFMFLQELRYVLEKNSKVNFIDEKELRNTIRSYSVQIKDFFSVVDIFIAQKRQANVEGWGSINENDFVTTKNYFQENFQSLK